MKRHRSQSCNDMYKNKSSFFYLKQACTNGSCTEINEIKKDDEDDDKVTNLKLEEVQEYCLKESRKYISSSFKKLGLPDMGVDKMSSKEILSTISSLQKL